MSAVRKAAQVNSSRRIFFVAIASAGLFACDPTQPCDDGQSFLNGLCYAGATPDAGSPADAGSLADAGACTANAFGSACAVNTDCGCGLDYCRSYSGVSYCTMTGCKASPSICPAGWSCTDLSAYNPSLPSICTRP
jgi:hypothetical protein